MADADYEDEFEEYESPEKAPGGDAALSTAAAADGEHYEEPSLLGTDALPPPPAAAAAASAASAASMGDPPPPATSFSPAAAPTGSKIPIARGTSHNSRSRARISRLPPTPAAPAGSSPGARGGVSLPSIGSGSAVASASSDALGESELLASEQLSLAVEAEMQAQEHLRRIRAKVQRELRKASSMSALNSVREKKLEMAKAMRKDLDVRVGRDITERIRSEELAPATEEEVKKLSTLFNKQLEAYHPDARNFFVLFKAIDIDGSRRISFNEFARLIRDELKLRRSELPEERLLALWKVLDENASGFIDAGELGRFMKIGRPEGGLGARHRVVREKRVGRAAQLEALDRRSGRAITKLVQTTSVEKASDAEVLQLATLFNQQLAMLRRHESSANANFFQLFKKVDVDDSGRIQFEELRRMVRHELHLGKEVLPREKLLSLWKVLDENESGFICAGEWGRFMNQRGVVTNPLPDPALIAKERAREKEAHQRAAKAAEWKAQAATRAQAQAKKIAAEAEALEAALSAAMKGNALPSIGGGGGGGGMRRGASLSALETLKHRFDATTGSRGALPVQRREMPPRAHE